MNRVRAAVLDAAAVLLPVHCSGCGAGDRAVCDACRSLLAPRPHTVRRGGLDVVAGLEYAGVARRVIAAYKDGGRTDAARALTPALDAALAGALAGRAREGIELLVVPPTASSARARGYRPVDRVLALAGFRPARVLRHVAARLDQAGLGREDRHVNLVGTLEARRPLDGRFFVAVDDILTTGSTLAEAARAVGSAGGEVIAGAVIAETPLRHARMEVKW
ncbi:ComF family protein [Agromyces atrinae]|uniref:ComF family protein n=1 Tax=Agromyces atrinae TaxID=592376 RepID=A0A4Q2M7L5_9MICO|nr:phosphoribosyltransferase family protein [Agromyces atrinae]NYD66640.1 putative amidophosphoribosyltransferase [Agromyces atrinae]RXZ87307.1 ComF family protein [Agromyces atrinae]